MTEEYVLAQLRSWLAQYGSQKALAVRLGVSVQYLNDVLRGRREVGPAVLAGLGLEKVVTYRPASPTREPTEYEAVI